MTSSGHTYEDQQRDRSAARLDRSSTKVRSQRAGYAALASDGVAGAIREITPHADPSRAVVLPDSAGYRDANVPPRWTDRLRPWVLAAATVDYLVLVIAISAGAAIRLLDLNRIGFNSDEAVYLGQGAAIAGVPELTPYFPIFRAHPLLFQFVLALVTPLTELANADYAGRLVAVAVGLLTILLIYRTGSALYGRRVGAWSALILAVMPYHVVVTRQVLLDGPQAMLATLTLYLMVQYSRTRRPIWLYATGAGMGLTFLAKESSIILLGAVFAFLALSPEIRVRIRHLFLSVCCMVIVMSPFPLSIMLAGGGGSERAQQYLVWQLFRRPNHDWTFYPTTVFWEIGPAVVILAALGFWLFREQFSWKEKLLIIWIAVPALFFQVFPVKGYQYLLLVAPPLAILAARTLSQISLLPLLGRFEHRFSTGLGWLRIALLALVVLSLFAPTWDRLHVAASDRFIAGSGGVAGGREAGKWVMENTPEGSQLMTIGPSMANIIQFYGHRKAYGLSVSPNPLHRNPSYEPVRNPDLQLRTGEIQYIVWDSYSAARSQFFSESVITYVRRYHGRVVHTESIRMRSDEGEYVETPVIIIYEVRP